jgi:murein DD-endopeptidase MepM/ murein hydrolase activator NlpD
VGKIRRVNLTFKTLAIFALFLATFLILLGIGLQYAGFRMAVEYNPQLARQLGNLHTAAEIENLNSFYRIRLTEVQAQLNTNSKMVAQLEATNDRLIVLATPPAIKESAKVKAMGGPYLSKMTGSPSTSLFDAFANSLSDLKSRNNSLTQSIEDFNRRIDWLGSKPISYPLKSSIDISSPFGSRIDPITHDWSGHQGIDFQAPIGTMILSSASGVVQKVAWNHDYGKEVIINHGDGYATRYAHTSETLVTEGMKVDRLTPIAKVGNSGRATGAHLHFEILKDGKPINPSEWLVGMNTGR